MSKSVWNGTLSVGLLVMPVSLHRATDDDDYTFNQVHKEDGGRIRYQRRCEACGLSVDYDDIGKGKEVGGTMYVLTDEELDELPLPGNGQKVIGIDRFIPHLAIDPSMLGLTYNIVTEGAGARVYALLRQQLKRKRKVGIGTFAMRSKDSLVSIRPFGNLLQLQRLEWPENVRVPDFKFLREEVTVTEVETELAAMLVDTMSGPWEPELYRSAYAAAVAALIQSKLDGTPPPVRTPQQVAAVTDISAVLRQSIDAKKKELADKEDAPS